MEADLTRPNNRYVRSDIRLPAAAKRDEAPKQEKAFRMSGSISYDIEFLSRDFDGAIDIEASDGTIVGSGSGARNERWQIPFDPAQDDIYRIRITSTDGRYGSYSLTILSRRRSRRRSRLPGLSRRSRSRNERFRLSRCLKLFKPRPCTQ